MPEYSKEQQLDASHRRDSTKYWCATTGKSKRTCDCRSCIGTRNQRMGKVRQRKARKGLGIDVPSQAAGGNEETWGGDLRVEVKGGKQCDPVKNAYLKVEAQSEEARAIGDPRDFVAVFMPDDFGGDGLLVYRLSKWEDVLRSQATSR